MTVQEMHLAIQQGVDKINSLQADLLLSEEIDIELNKSQMKFINTKYGRNNIYKEGFEQSQKRIDDLRSLIQEYENLVNYKETYDDRFEVDMFQLPEDYMYLVNQRSTVYHNWCNPIAWNVSVQAPIYFCILPFDSFICNDSTGFIQDMRLVANAQSPALGNVPVVNPTALTTYNSNPTTYPADVENVKANLLDPSNWNSGFELYWEQLGGLHYPGSIIVVVNTNIHDWFNWDSSATNTVSGSNAQTKLIGLPTATNALTAGNNQVAYADHIVDGLDRRRDIITRSGQAAAKRVSKNRYCQQDDIFTLLDDPFNTTKLTSPLTTIRGRYIDIYTSDIFVIDKVKITYIRKPREISLSLGVSCELPTHCHQEIVDMTVSSILEGISDPRYKSQQMELSKNE